MKKTWVLLPLLVLFFLNPAFANGYINGDLNNGTTFTKTKAYDVSTAKGKGAAGKMRARSFSSAGEKRPTVLDLYTGSLKNNITRLGREFAWRTVIWDVPHDYQWTGNTEVVASSLQDALRKVLRDYPLQAVFYLGNRVLLIRPRTLQ